jgi:hypothetical protein
MNADQKIIKNKVGLLNLSEVLGVFQGPSRGAHLSGTSRQFQISDCVLK